MDVLTLIIALFVAFIFYNFHWKRRNLPPGPTPLPIVGNILTLLKYAPGTEAFRMWRRQYGDVYTYWIGEMPVVAVNDYQMMVETFVKDGDAVSGRMDIPKFHELSRGGQYGVIHTDGELWREQRRFALHVLRDFGLGKNIMQDRVLIEVSSLLEAVRARIEAGEEEHNLMQDFDVSVGSIINNLLLGYRFEGDNLAEYQELKRILSEQNHLLGHPMAMAMWRQPQIMRHLPLFNSFSKRLIRNKQTLMGFFSRQIQEHKSNVELESETEPTDYVEAYLKEAHKRNKHGEANHFSHEQLLNMIFDMWAAGQETTSSTLSWAAVFLINNQGAQEKMHEELARVTGGDRLVTLADKPKLVFTNAVICEVQRMANLLAQNLRHRTTRAITVGGYLIPEGTTILPQISMVLTDEKIFPEPHLFKPERFINESTGDLKKVDELIPFSLGKRQCLGESLARMELFLFIANIFAQFKLSPYKGRTPSLERCIGTTNPPVPFTCGIEKRRQ
ncbi:Protein CYP-33C1 [Aphelenchoides avenae]|nr:Protein CYP-33C1 [Aphelenchus avenae]